MAERPVHGTIEFKLVFGAVIALTVLFGLGAALVVYFPPPRDNGLLDTFTTLLKLGAGAIFGLVGGRATT